MLANEVAFFDSERNTHLESRSNFPVPRIGETITFNYLSNTLWGTKTVNNNRSFSGRVVAIERIYDERENFTELVEVYLELD